MSDTPSINSSNAAGGPSNLVVPRQQQHEAARGHARVIANKLAMRFDQSSPTSEVATIADTSRLVEFGFVTATAARGPIQVVGIDVANWRRLMPGVRIYVRRMRSGGMQSYLYDGIAPMAKPAASTGGSIGYDVFNGDNVNIGIGAGVAMASSGYMQQPEFAINSSAQLFTIPSGGPNVGWYWSCAFCFARTPTQDAVLFEMPSYTSATDTYGTTGYMQYLGSGGITLQYTPNATLRISVFQPWSTVSTLGWETAAVFAPGRTWWVTFQAGNGLAINGVHRTDGSYDLPFLTDGTMHAPASSMRAGFWLLSNESQSSVCPDGTWISKVSFGCSAQSGVAVWPHTVVNDPTVLDSSYYTPSADTDIPNGNAALGAGLTTYARYLVADVGACTLASELSDGVTLAIPNTGAAGSTAPLSINPSGGLVFTSGPY